ncbi:MAG: hypothetical protein PHU06_09370 [Gallionella sp.]|nr:hypothetical protein [Gallionella sp.]MDD4959581.1 hypothetical protein [Gallionella sp.]
MKDNRLSVSLRGFPPQQCGAALLVMLVILVLGALTLFVNTLNSAAINQARQAQTEAALALAKDALIGRALSNPNMPASLPCPDLVTHLAGNNMPNDGVADLFNGNDCPSYIGRFPWRTLGLGDVRDGWGERLWYVLSPNMRDDESAKPLNSDTAGQLSLQGDMPQSPLLAMVFSANVPLDGQARSSANENSVAHYLEGENSNGDTIFSRLASTTQFNDVSISLSADQLFPLVEKRVLREIRVCLDDYAAASGGKYPWASPVSDTNHYWGAWQTYFGHIPAQPNILLGAVDASTAQFIEALVSVQVALNHYVAANNGNTRPALSLAATQLNLSAQAASDPVSTTAISAALYAADLATNLAQKSPSAGATVIQAGINGVQGQINLVRDELRVSGLIDPNMALAWTARCTAFSAGYWDSWKNLLFYQIAVGYQPGGNGDCGTSCLAITGSGHAVAGSMHYRAVVVNAGRALSGQVRSTNAVSAYLETTNMRTTADTLTFVTYRPDDIANAALNNDLVFCLDGRQYCK